MKRCPDCWISAPRLLPFSTAIHYQHPQQAHAHTHPCVRADTPYSPGILWNIGCASLSRDYMNAFQYTTRTPSNFKHSGSRMNRSYQIPSEWLKDLRHLPAECILATPSRVQRRLSGRDPHLPWAQTNVRLQTPCFVLFPFIQCDRLLFPIFLRWPRSLFPSSLRCPTLFYQTVSPCLREMRHYISQPSLRFGVAM